MSSENPTTIAAGDGFHNKISLKHVPNDNTHRDSFTFEGNGKTGQPAQARNHQYDNLPHISIRMVDQISSPVKVSTTSNQSEILQVNGTGTITSNDFTKPVFSRNKSFVVTIRDEFRTIPKQDLEKFKAHDTPIYNLDQLMSAFLVAPTDMSTSSRTSPLLTSNSSRELVNLDEGNGEIGVGKPSLAKRLSFVLSKKDIPREQTDTADEVGRVSASKRLSFGSVKVHNNELDRNSESLEQLLSGPNPVLTKRLSMKDVVVKVRVGGIKVVVETEEEGQGEAGNFYEDAVLVASCSSDVQDRPLPQPPSRGDQSSGVLSQPLLPSIGEGDAAVDEEYEYPIARLPVQEGRNRTFQFGELSRLEHLTYGSNSTISSAYVRGIGNVILKLVKHTVQNRETASEEFQMEHDTLCRLRFEISKYDVSADFIGSDFPPCLFSSAVIRI